MKEWIENNIVSKGKIPARRCSREWFSKVGWIEKYNELLKETEFLDNLNPSLPQRLWHIINDVRSPFHCGISSCNNSPTFLCFSKGYLEFCSSYCAQNSPLTKTHIKETNLINYGTEYGFQNEMVKEKCKSTILKKYGVENISQADGISEKKQKTCLSNYGTKWFLERTDLITQRVKEKYGVTNILKLPSIIQKRVETRRGDFYDSLLNTNRLKGMYIPLFSKDEYISGGLYKKYSFECVKCKTHFEDCLEDGDLPRCTTCYKNSSVFEKEITEYIKSILSSSDIVMENTKTILSNNYELDIYIPSKKLAIECNGLFWHGELGGNKGKDYHLNKTIECEKLGIRLIHIFEDEWVLSKNIVKNRLLHILNNKAIKSVYARKCIIKEISSIEKNKFLTENHIQGADNSKIRIGLIYNNTLVSVMTFGNKRIFTNNKSKEGEYELIRFATSVPIIGAAGKMLSYFIKTYIPKKIISYADRRWTFSDNNLYEKIGFKKISNGTPNYWYFGRDGNYRRFHRFGFAKHNLQKRLVSFDPLLTEWENMKNNGWDRIWDCGNLKYEMDF